MQLLMHPSQHQFSSHSSSETYNEDLDVVLQPDRQPLHSSHQNSGPSMLRFGYPSCEVTQLEQHRFFLQSFHHY